MLGFMAKKASIAVQMLQWKSSSGTVAAGSHTAPRRFPCVPANPAPVLTQQKQESPRARAQLPAVLRELHLPMAPMWCSPAERRRPGMHRETPGNAQLRSCPPTCKTQTQKPGQTSQWTFLPVDILEGRVCSRSSAPKPTPAAGGSQPGIAPIPAPQLRVLPLSSCSRTLG